jgi:hypothetical protein
MEEQLPAFWMSALDGGEWSVSRSGRSNKREQSPSTMRITVCVGPTDGLNAWGKKNFLAYIRTYYPGSLSKWYISKGQLACNDVNVIIWPLIWQFITPGHSSCCPSQVPNWETNDTCFKCWCTFNPSSTYTILFMIYYPPQIHNKNQD